MQPRARHSRRSSRRWPTAIALVFLTGAVAAEDAGATPPSSGEVTARATLRHCTEDAEVGTAYLRERASSEGVKEVDILLRVSGGIPAGKHAVHIHQTAKCKPCSAAGGHFDPGPHGHTSPDGNHPFHAGDLVNVDVDAAGQGMLVTVTTRLTLSDGPLSIFDADGSAFIVLDTDPFVIFGEPQVAHRKLSPVSYRTARHGRR